MGIYETRDGKGYAITACPMPTALGALLAGECRGAYQSALLAGDRAWSGSDCPIWGGKSRASRSALLGRWRGVLAPYGYSVSVPLVLMPGPNGRRWTRCLRTLGPDGTRYEP